MKQLQWTNAPAFEGHVESMLLGTVLAVGEREPAIWIKTFKDRWDCLDISLKTGKFAATCGRMFCADHRYRPKYTNSRFYDFLQGRKVMYLGNITCFREIATSVSTKGD